ncbi:MAG: MerR family transcriptional regulator [Acidobacteria bacterium]|nr:MerR family transcriptional regulator [Acidobacteriota bacterium]
MLDPTLVPSASPEIPDKLYFRIGEVARLAGVNPSVLRYWENEFSIIDPKKSGSNHRLYRRKDVEHILEIKHLLYEKRYTIQGARQHFAASRGKAEKSKVKVKVEAKPVQPAQAALFAAPNPPLISEIRKELQSILDSLK